MVEGGIVGRRESRVRPQRYRHGPSTNGTNMEVRLKPCTQEVHGPCVRHVQISMSPAIPHRVNKPSSCLGLFQGAWGFISDTFQSFFAPEFLSKGMPVDLCPLFIDNVAC